MRRVEAGNGTCAGCGGARAVSLTPSLSASRPPREVLAQTRRTVRRASRGQRGGSLKRHWADWSGADAPAHPHQRDRRRHCWCFVESSHGPGRDCFRRQPATEPSHPGPPAAHSRLRTDGCRLRLRCRREDAASDCRFGSTQPWRRSRAAGAADTDDSWSFVHAAVSQGAAPTNHPERLLSRSGHSQRAASAI